MANIFEKADRADIQFIAEKLGLNWGTGWDRPFQVLCPLHDERNPSARIYPDTNSGYCWTCQKAFGSVSLVAAQEQVSFTRAAHLVGEWASIDLRPTLEEAEAERLTALWEDPPAIGDPNNLRRTAAMLVRPVGLPWEVAELLMGAYEVLDHTTIEPRTWVAQVGTLTP